MLKLDINCTGGEFVDYSDLRDLQGSLKSTSPQKLDSLIKSLKTFGLINPVQIWVSDSGNMYCFDAHHRKKALSIMESQGYNIPKIPAVRCLAKNKKEAKKMLLAKESKYSWIDLGEIEDYLAELDLTLDVANDLFEIDLPEAEGCNVFDDDVNLPDGQIQEKEALIKISFFCDVSIKKEIFQKLNDIKNEYNPGKIRLI